MYSRSHLLTLSAQCLYQFVSWEVGSVVHTTEVTAGEGRGGCVCGGGEKVGWDVCVRRGSSVCEVEGWEVCVRGRGGSVCVCVYVRGGMRGCVRRGGRMCVQGGGVCVREGRRELCERERGARVCVG